MNLAAFSIHNNRVSFAAMALVLLGGLVAYNRIGRLEDPEFTIKEALIITPYPGASAEQVAKEVTNPIETAVQQLGQLDRVESESTRGRSVVSAIIKDRYDRATMPQVWDELRRKINDVQRQLPPSVRGQSMVVDDFGDVFGIFLAISGDGFTSAELRRYAEFLRRELLLVQDVEKVELFAAQQEVVFLELSRQRLARLGFSEEQIYSQLQARNIAADGGRVQVGNIYPPVDPTGAFSSAADMLDLVIGSDQTGRQMLLGDVATLERGDEDPPRRLLRFDGKPAIGIGISTVSGGNVVTMGQSIRQRLAYLEVNQPLGIEISEINFQPTAVTEATNDFAFNLLKAVSIVFAVLLIAMGLRAGTIIGGILFLTIMGTFLVMQLDGTLLLERISLGALIIALCMLTDNAIVVTEGMKVRMEAGEDKLTVASEVVAQNQWPLFGATSIAVVAFAAIGLSEDSTGEYVNSLFWVILISLSLSWIAAITFTPLLCYLFFKADPNSKGHDSYDSWFFRGYKALLVTALRFRYAVVVLTLALFALAVYGFGRIDQNFFPPSTRPQFMLDVFLPAGTHIRESERFAEEVGRHIQEQPGVTHVTSFIGGGGLRFLLVYSPESENRAYVQFLIDVDDQDSIEGALTGVQAYIEESYPDANAVAKRFLLGPGGGGRVQVRFSGADPSTLRALADQALTVFQEDRGAIGIRSDWREREKVIRPGLLEFQARRNGITRVEVAQALESGFEGRVVGFYREPGGAERGTFPQETRLLPILSRPPLAERSDVGAINSMQIWSPTARRMIPMNQVVSGVAIEWEDPIVMRRDRSPTNTVHADPRSGLPSALFNRVREKIEQIQLPAGYTREWGGEHEDSGNARGALAESLPTTLLLVVFIVVCLFNSIRSSLVVLVTVPFAIIGVTVGLLVTNQPFGFMALLGVIALAGEQVKNSVVLVEEVHLQKAAKKTPYAALVDASVARLRPVLLVAVTTVLGMIPLLQDAFFSAMAATIMFGLAFACVLTMIVVPVLYSILYGIEAEADAPSQ